MGRYFSRIVRTLFVALFGVGGGVGLMTFIFFTIYSDQQTAVEQGLKAALVIGLSFGTLLATVMILTDLTMRLTVSAGRKEDEVWELEQARQIEMRGTLKEVKRHCREALMAVPNLMSVLEDSSETAMTASIGRSWRSSGEVVQVTIVPVEEGVFKVTCTSHCVQKQVGFDYAKNFENVETWLAHISRDSSLSSNK
jgi:hypothetical protein